MRKLKGSSFKSSLGKARGFGSAKDGTDHWWAQRVSAVALIGLVAWFVFSVVMLAKSGASYEASILWLHKPINALLSALLIAAALYHAVLGLRVVVEDYITCPATKLVLLMGIPLASFFAGGYCVFSIIRIFFGTV